jgi:hypothetical protein
MKWWGAMIAAKSSIACHDSSSWKRAESTSGTRIS